MCLIINKPADVEFDDLFLEDVFDRNADGIGVMYAQDNVLYTAKMVPYRFADVKAFWESHIKGRECSVHFRMATHGDIDVANSHPYTVISSEEGYPLSLIHNGVLPFGNAKDKTKSDTWHYINDYLRPMLLKNPTFFLTEAFADIVSAHIGHGNKFVLMDAYGNVVTINERAGVKYNGAWLSNTYAWNTKGTEHDSFRSFRRPYGGYGGFQDDVSELFPCNYAKPSTYDYRRPAVVQPLNPAGWEKDDEELEGVDAQGAADQEDDEADYFVSEFFSILNAAGLSEAYAAISFDNALDWYHAVGMDTALGVIDAVELGSYSSDEIIAEVLAYASEEVPL